MAEKIRVLIVDDDVPFAESLSDVLEEKGYDAQAVNSGGKALEKIKEIPFEVVLMDIKMPVMDGVETFKKMRRIRPQMPVIMMTAYSVEDLIKDALKEGAYGVVHKPLDIGRVIKTIEAAGRDGVLVMVVDDDPHTRETLKDIFEDKGYVVILAKDGEEAIKIARERPIDVLFVDMKLPVLNGLEVYLTIRKINPKIVAVMITAYQQEMKDLIEQALAKGAYSCLYKPFDPKETVDIVEEIAKRKDKKTTRRPTMGKKILIVEDEANVRTSLADILKEKGYRVVEAVGEESVLGKVRKEKPDLVLMDTILPGMDGISICRQIKQVEKLDTKVIVYTGKVDAVDAGKAREAGADDYVVKTEDLSHLLGAIENLV